MMFFRNHELPLKFSFEKYKANCESLDSQIFGVVWITTPSQVCNMFQA